MSSRDTELHLHPGQIAQFFKKAAAIGLTREEFARLGQASPEQFRIIDAYLRGAAKLTKVSFLNSVGSITPPGVKRPPVLKAGDGIYFWGNAKALFQNIESRPLQKMGIAYGDLTERRNDFQILEEIGDEPIFEVEELSLQLARLLKKQAGGTAGPLLNDGKANIFFVRNPNNPEQVLYVFVGWRADAAGWLVRVDPASASAWRVGDRFFRKCGSSVT